MQLTEQILKMPPSFRAALMYLLIGWSSLILTVQLLFKDQVLTVKLLVSGGIICFSVYQRRKWAKWLALFCNAIVILYGSFYAYLFLHGNLAVSAFILAVDILLLAIASYYLLLKSSSDYFVSPAKQVDATAEGQEDKTEKGNR